MANILFTYYLQAYIHFVVVDGLVATSCLTLVIPWTVACQAPLSMVFSRQDYWSGLPFPSPIFTLRSFKSRGSYQEGYNLFFPYYYLWFYVTNHFKWICQKEPPEGIPFHLNILQQRTQDQAQGNGFGMIQGHPQLQLSSSSIRSQRLGTLALQFITSMDSPKP